MIVNFSLLFLNIYSISNSPIVSFSSTSFSTTQKFENLAVKNILNNFYYENSRNFQKNFLTIKRSMFTNTLSTAIFLTSEDYYWINSSVHFTEQTVYDLIGRWYINIDNCCFSGCKTTSSQTNGGAIATLMLSCALNLTSCIFKNCVAEKWGGAIMCGSQNFNLESDIFAGCQAESGMALFYNHGKIGIQSWGSFLKMNRIGFFNNKGKHDVTDMNISQLNCLNSNFSNNINEESNIPTSQTQYCCAFSMLADDWNQNFKFLNFIGNKGDFLIDFNEKPNGQIFYVNVIGNYGLNYFFHFDRPIPNPINNGPYIYLNDFCFFNNKANVDSLGIFIANTGVPIQFVLQNCMFDFSNSMLSSILNGHLESGSICDQSLSSAVTYTMNDFLIKPSICEVDTDFATQVTTPSSESSASKHFTSSSKFTSSSPFSPSLTFTLLLPVPIPSSSISIFSSSGTFTPSNHFTPSFTFSPNRTKVPDPMDIFHQAHITGKKDIFTKEELKKAAAPVSISLALIIFGVVMMIYYLHRRIKQLKDLNIPEFDSSFSDEFDSDSEYSYSYYTYTYTYAYYSEALSETDQEREYELGDYYNDETEYQYSEFTYDDNSSYY